MARRTLRWLHIAALAIGYPLLAHYTNTYAHNNNLGALVSILPVILIALMLAWKSPVRPILLGALILSCIGLWFEWSVLQLHFGLVYWLQYVGIQLILFMTFARTLINGRQPLCTRFAEALHAPLSPQHEIYARRVTVAWTLFFAAMALTSTLLFFLAPLTTWSVFDNFLTAPLIAAMFIAEYRVRKYALPEMQNAHILDAVRAFRNTSLSPR